MPPLQIGIATSRLFRCQPTATWRTRYEFKLPVAVDAKAADSAADIAAYTEASATECAEKAPGNGGRDAMVSTCTHACKDLRLHVMKGI